MHNCNSKSQIRSQHKTHSLRIIRNRLNKGLPPHVNAINTTGHHRSLGVLSVTQCSLLILTRNVLHLRITYVLYAESRRASEKKIFSTQLSVLLRVASCRVTYPTRSLCGVEWCKHWSVTRSLLQLVFLSYSLGCVFRFDVTDCFRSRSC